MRSRFIVVLIIVALALTASAQPASVNVCSPSFQCFADVDCQSVGERVPELWACKAGHCLKVDCIIDLECDKDLACLDNKCQEPRTSSVGGRCDITAGLRCPSGSQCDLKSKICKDSESTENGQCDYQSFPPCGNGLTCLPFDDGVLRCVNPAKTVRALGDACSENADGAPPPTLCAIGLSCVNHKCTHTKVPQVGDAKCDDSCKSHAECETGVCLGGKCEFGYLKQNETCIDGVQCESGQCKSGKCSGQDCSSMKCKDTEVCIAVPGGQPMCLTDPSSCLPDEVWIEGSCVSPPQLGERCDPLTAPCSPGQYCDPRTSGCVQSVTLNQPCGWAYNSQARQLESNCTAQAGELCFCDGVTPTCKRLSEPEKPANTTMPLTLKRLSPPPANGDQPLDNNLKNIQIGQGCKGVLQDPYSLLCVKELGSPGRLQSPLLSFAFAVDESEKEKSCRDFWAKWSCCNICLQSALDEAAALDQNDLVARGLPGLSCSVDKVALTPQLGTSDGVCVIGPEVSLQTRAWYRGNFCANDFLGKFVDKTPYAFTQSAEGTKSPQAQNTSKTPVRSGAEGKGQPSLGLIAIMVALTLLMAG